MSSELAELAAKAEQARVALIGLSEAAKRVPGIKVNLVRPIELIGELARRAKAAAYRSAPEDEEVLSRSLAASLAALQADGSPLAMSKAEQVEREMRRALAAENGARGGLKMTERKRAALAKLHEKRRAKTGRANAEHPRGGSSPHLHLAGGAWALVDRVAPTPRSYNWYLFVYDHRTDVGCLSIRGSQWFANSSRLGDDVRVYRSRLRELFLITAVIRPVRLFD